MLGAPFRVQCITFRSLTLHLPANQPLTDRPMPLLMMLFSRNGIKIIKTHDESYALTLPPLMKPYDEKKKKRKRMSRKRTVSCPPRPFYLPAPKRSSVCATEHCLSSNRCDRRRSRRSTAVNSSKHLLGSAPDDAARNRQVGALLEVKIDLTRRLATLVDTPRENPS